MNLITLVRAVVAVACVALATSAFAQRTKVDIVVFGPPSLGAFLPPVIKAQKLDLANGLELNFVERTPDAYIART
jgi:NitT/TauT family transport system substrate-binding protein